MEATSRPAELDRSPAGALPRVEVAALAVLGLAKLTVHLLTSASYGFHGDELYSWPAPVTWPSATWTSRRSLPCWRG